MTEREVAFCVVVPVAMLCCSAAAFVIFPISIFGFVAILLWLSAAIVSFIAGVMPAKADPLVPEDDYTWIPDRIDFEEEWLK